MQGSATMMLQANFISKDTVASYGGRGPIVRSNNGNVQHGEKTSQ